MDSHNKSHKKNPRDLDKKTIIQNFDFTSIQASEEVNDLLENDSLEEENSLTFDELDFFANSQDDTQDLLPFIEDSREIDLETEELEPELDIDLSASLDSILDSDLNSEGNLHDLGDIDDVVADSIELDLPDISDNFGELDDVLEETLTDNDEFDSLDNLLDAERDLDNLLDNKPEPSLSQVVPVQTPPVKINSPRQPEASKAKAFDQTMRVSVKKLDNLNNMIGELVVKRNRLEEDQERLRRFLDNLLNHVQSLGEMGSKMHDLYERSLLEGALIASRQQNQSSSRKISSYIDSSIQEEEDDELNALELDRFTGFHLLSQDIIELIVRVREAASDIQFVVDETDKVAQSLRQVTGQLQDGMNSSRMVPFEQTTDRLPRAIRDISYKLQKQVELKVEGKDVLIDKMILENLYNPMTHLVNNAITHGIESPETRIQLGKKETGIIHIRAFLQGNQTVITITDDGAGIDPEKVKTKAVEKNLITWAQAQNLSKQDVYDLLFRAGFSTKDQADDFAGRGVGMDVVSTDLKKIRGTISIESEIGKGTVFTIRLPLVLSICKALTCVFNGTRIAFPIDGIEDTREYNLSDIHTNANGVKSISWKNSLLPFQPLSNLLSYNRRTSRADFYNTNQEEDTLSIVILRSTDNLLALEVDQVLGEQEIVIKQMEAPIPKPAGVAGATVLGDGTIMPIGDVLELIEIAQGKRTINLGFSIWQGGKAKKEEKVANEPMVLVVDDSITVRELLTLSFNKLGYRVEQARDGQEAWDKLRGGLPCDMIFCDIEMPRMNGLELLSNLQKDEKLQLVPVAMLTSRGAEKHRQMATDLGAKAYLTKPYTEKDLMDVAQRLIEISQKNKAAESMVTHLDSELTIHSLDSQSSINPNPLVLIIDDSVTVRELLATTFVKAGYRVEKAKDGQDAWDKLKGGLACDLAFCDIEMPRMNGLELLAELQKDNNLSQFPIAMLTSRGAQKMRNMAAKRGARGYFVKPYVEEALLDAAQKMLQGEMLLELDMSDNEEE